MSNRIDSTYISIIDKNYRYATVSKNYLEDKQLSPKNVFNTHISEIWGTEIFEKYVKPNIDKAFNGEIAMFEGWFKFKNNKKRYFKAKYIPLINSKNEVNYVSVVTTDYTKEKTLERNLFNKIYKDQLTNVYNRRSFEENLNLLTQKMGYSLILLDLDNFKNVNDTYGHQKGDEILKIFTNLVQNLVGTNSKIYRIGGDEFAIIVNDSSEEITKSLAKKIIHFVSESELSKYNVSVSIGIANVNNIPVSIGELIKLCDEQLYKSKNAGKNTYNFINL